MKLEEILSEWEKDAPIDETKLGKNSLDTAKLHAKYLRYYSTEKMVLAKAKAEIKSLFIKKLNYYRGRMTDEERNELGWEINPVRIDKTEVNDYIQGDRDFINENLKISVYQERVDALEAILKQISVRQFSIKNAIDYARLMNGN